MNINWSALAEVAVVGFAVGITVVVVFALGVRAWSLRPQAGDDGTKSPSRGGSLTTAAAGLCFFACVLIVCYGIYLLIPQLH